MKKKVDRGVQVTILLPKMLIETAKRIARDRAQKEQVDVSWNDIVRSALVESIK